MWTQTIIGLFFSHHMYTHWRMIRCYLNIEAGNPTLMLYLFLGYKFQFSKQETYLTSTFTIFSSVCEESANHFLGYLVKFNGVFLFSWVTTLLATCELICDVISCWDYCEYPSVYDRSYDWQYLTVYCLPNWPDFLEINIF